MAVMPHSRSSIRSEGVRGRAGLWYLSTSFRDIKGTRQDTERSWLQT